MIRVTLVDDDARFREIARRLLTEDGVDVVAEAGTGEEALRVLADVSSDVVLLDIGLPDISGLEVARRLSAGRDGRVVILISTRDVEYGDRAAEGIAAGYIHKGELSLAAIQAIRGPSP